MSGLSSYYLLCCAPTAAVRCDNALAHFACKIDVTGELYELSAAFIQSSGV